MSSLAQPVPVTSPSPRSAGARVAGGVLTLVGLSAWSIVLLVLCVLEPKFEQIFRDFGTQLPIAARVSIGFSRWLIGGNPGQFPGIVLVAPALLGLTFGLFCTRRYWPLALLFMLAGMMMIGALVVANFTPLVTLIESLQQQSGP